MWLREEQKSGTEREITAESLMESARGVGLDAACEKYREILRLKPGCTQVLFQALDQILDDFCFTAEEESNMQELMLMIPLQEEETVLEKLEENPQQAGTFFYRMGLAYWYFYEGSGGRSAGAAWFQKAVDIGRKNAEEADWLESANIYMELSAYYDCLGRREEKDSVYLALWKKLVQLWNSPGLIKETVQVRTEAAQELLACVVMGAAKLRENEEEVGEMLTALEDFLENELKDEEEKKEFCIQLEGAQMAWQRASTAFAK